jgi:hypothetical protein
MKDAVINYSTAQKWGMKDTERSQGFNKIADNSLLSSGTWYKFIAPTEGIYKIDYNSLSSFGIDPNNVDPRTIRIFNNGGFQLSEAINIPRNPDLNEIAIQVIGESDGKFDANDYILFYGRSTDFWYYNQNSNKIIRNKHFYDDDNYYLITSGGADGKRVAPKPSIAETNTFKQTTTTAAVYHEDDLFNIIKSGRIYVGEAFSSSNNSRTYFSTLSNLIPNTEINYKISFVNYSDADVVPTVSLQVSENGNQILSRSLFRISSYRDGRQNIFDADYSGSLPGNLSSLKFVFNSPSPVVSGYLDYFEIQYQAYMRANSDILTFFAEDTTASIEYTISDFTNSAINIYDVTDYSDVKVITGAAISGGQAIFKANEIEGTPGKYLACTSAQMKTPSNPVKIDNSNLRGNIAGADFIIISNKIFKEQAERLRDYRANISPNKLSTRLVYIDDIFNEFSNGLLDPTAMRDFFKVRLR